MKRMLLAAATSSLLVLAAPGVASAHHAKCHGRSHHACAHLRRAHHARIVSFGSPLPSTGTTTAPTAPSGETAGKVASFTGGVLTITLNDNSTVSGKVTDQTDLSCQSATEGTETDDNADRTGDENSGGNGDDSSHSGSRLGSMGDDMSAGADGEDGGDGGQASCTSAALVPGAVVREAELSISSAGAIWKHVDLLQ